MAVVVVVVVADSFDVVALPPADQQILNTLRQKHKEKSAPLLVPHPSTHTPPSHTPHHHTHHTPHTPTYTAYQCIFFDDLPLLFPLQNAHNNPANNTSVDVSDEILQLGAQAVVDSLSNGRLRLFVMRLCVCVVCE